MTGLRKRFRVLIVPLVLLGVAVGAWFWFFRDAPRYESGFTGYVLISLPRGHRFEERKKFTEAIDAYLRGRRLGYVGGVLGRGEPSEIESIELKMEIDNDTGRRVGDLIEEWTGDGWLPAGVTFEAGSYPYPVPEWE